MVSFAIIMQIFALLNPPSSFPFLIAAYEKKMNVRKIAVTAVVSAFIIAVIITLVGPSLFSLFGTTLDSFKIAGGIVLLLLGIDMVRSYDKNHREVTGTHSIIAIIATPLLTGPATISYITIKAYEIGKIDVLINLCWSFVLVGITFILFSFLIKKISYKIIDVASRVMGLFLTAVAVEMIAQGINGILISTL